MHNRKPSAPPDNLSRGPWEGQELPTSPQLTYQRHALTQHAIVLLLLSLVVGALVIFVFGWDPVDVAIETAIGIAVWGGLQILA